MRRLLVSVGGWRGRVVEYAAKRPRFGCDAVDHVDGAEGPHFQFVTIVSKGVGTSVINTWRLATTVQKDVILISTCGLVWSY